MGEEKNVSNGNLGVKSRKTKKTAEETEIFSLALAKRSETASTNSWRRAFRCQLTSPLIYSQRKHEDTHEKRNQKQDSVQKCF